MSHLQIKIIAGKDSLGRAAADQAATSIRRAIRQQGKSGENFSANRSTWRLSELGRMRTWHFNDPPADFEIDDSYLVVPLDHTCRQQQVNEGWFGSVADVPTQAISMSVRQILRSREIIVVVPDERKAQAVKQSLEGEITPMVPASILRRHPNATIYLDKDSAALLTSAVPAAT